MQAETKETVRKELIGAVGESKVLWSEADLLAYTKDTYRIRFEDDYRYFPDFAVLPETTEEVQRVVRVAAKHKIPLLPKGGGSNRTGMLVPIYGGIVVDTIKMDKVLEVNVPDLYVTVQPGLTLSRLEEQLADHGVWLTQEQGSMKVATVGGSISTSGFSRRHQKYGAIADRVMSLEVVLADGTMLRTGPKVLYTSTGYRLHQLFIGAEGTLGIITEATLRVEPLPEATDVMVSFYDNFWGANEAAMKTMASGVTFAGSEAYEAAHSPSLGAPEGKNGIFYVIFQGTKGEVAAEMEYVKGIMHDTGGILATPEVARTFLTMYAEQWCGARALTGYEDVLTTYIPMDRVKEYYDELWNRIGPKYGIEPLPGEKFSLDVGRYRMSGGRYRLPKGEKAWEKYQHVLREIAELATRLGGSVQACHGVGIQHRDNMTLEYSREALEMMRRVKKVFDPDNIMNPGKMIPDRSVA